MTMKTSPVTNLIGPALNKAPNGDFLAEFAPKLAGEDLQIDGQNIEKGTVLFPLELCKLLMSENSILNAHGFLIFNNSLQDTLKFSKAVLEPTINTVKNDIEGNFIRKGILSKAKDTQKVNEILKNYEEIISAVWSWESAFPSFNDLIENPASLNLTLAPAPELKIKTLLNTCTRQVDDLKANIIDLSLLDALFIKEYKDLYSLGLLTPLFSVLSWTSIQAAIIWSHPILIATAALMTVITVSTVIAIFVELIKLGLNYFEYYYRLPRALDRLNTKLNIIKNAFGIEDTESGENKSNILVERYKYLLLTREFVSNHDSPRPIQAEDNQSAVNSITQPEPSDNYRDTLLKFAQKEIPFVKGVMLEIAPIRYRFHSIYVSLINAIIKRLEL